MSGVSHATATILGALATAYLAACSALEWQRPNTDAAIASQDLQQCELQAKAYGRRLVSSGMSSKPTVSVSPRGEVGVAISPPAVAAADVSAEYDFLRSCMWNKGYEQRAIPWAKAGDAD